MGQELGGLNQPDIWKGRPEQVPYEILPKTAQYAANVPGIRGTTDQAGGLQRFPSTD